MNLEPLLDDLHSSSTNTFALRKVYLTRISRVSNLRVSGFSSEQHVVYLNNGLCVHLQK